MGAVLNSDECNILMALFLSNFRKKIDKKGRVSVPSTFRGVLAAESFNGIIAYQSFINPCVEACGMSRIEKLSERIESLDPFSEEHDAFSSTILGGSVQLSFDSEGRVTLPPELLEAAGITDELVFVGKGQTFEIWHPEAFDAHARQARELALQKRQQLRATTPAGGQQS
jgi:MraZ protein